MTHYQKLATIAIKIIGIIFISLSGIYFLFCFFSVLLITGERQQKFFMIMSLCGPLWGIGIVFFFSGKRLAKLVCRGFDKSE